MKFIKRKIDGFLSNKPILSKVLGFIWKTVKVVAFIPWAYVVVSLMLVGLVARNTTLFIRL